MGITPYLVITNTATVIKSPSALLTNIRTLHHHHSDSDVPSHRDQGPAIPNPSPTLWATNTTAILILWFTRPPSPLVQPSPPLILLLPQSSQCPDQREKTQSGCSRYTLGLGAGYHCACLSLVTVASQQPPGGTRHGVTAESWDLKFRV